MLNFESNHNNDIDTTENFKFKKPCLCRIVITFSIPIKEKFFSIFSHVAFRCEVRRMWRNAAQFSSCLSYMLNLDLSFLYIGCIKLYDLLADFKQILI